MMAEPDPVPDSRCCPTHAGTTHSIDASADQLAETAETANPDQATQGYRRNGTADPTLSRVPN